MLVQGFTMQETAFPSSCFGMASVKRKWSVTSPQSKCARVQRKRPREVNPGDVTGVRNTGCPWRPVQVVRWHQRGLLLLHCYYPGF